MQYENIYASNLIKTITFKDVLFKGNYTVDPYQNCSFGCTYCDSSFEKTVYIKTNAVELFKEEVSSIKKGRIIIGSVHDPYQPIEENVRITRDILEVVKEHDIPIHILTKSPLIKRDIDILQQIHDVLVTITIFTSDPKISKLFEPFVPSPRKRFQTISSLHAHQIKTGVALIPIMPYINDGTIEKLLITCISNHANHIIYKHLELKGDQKQMMMHLIEQIDPTLPTRYEQLYADNYAPHDTYIIDINKHIQEICHRLGLPSLTANE